LPAGAAAAGALGRGAAAASLPLAAGAAPRSAAGGVALADGSSTRIALPCETLSPSLTFSSFTTPPADDGISIDALSLSTVISDCSGLTVSPGLTSTSITSTSLKSPMSGTCTSTRWPISSALSYSL
jgi:hypothetical protein